MRVIRYALAVIPIIAIVSLGIHLGVFPTPWFLEQPAPVVTEVQVADWIEEKTWVEVVAWGWYKYEDGGIALIWYLSIDDALWKADMDMDAARTQLTMALYQGMYWAEQWGADAIVFALLGHPPYAPEVTMIGTAISVQMPKFTAWRDGLDEITPDDVLDFVEPHIQNLSMMNLVFECELPECTLHE